MKIRTLLYPALIAATLVLPAVALAQNAQADAAKAQQDAKKAEEARKADEAKKAEAKKADKKGGDRGVEPEEEDNK